MIQGEFQSNLEHYPDRPFLICSAGQWSYAEFYRDVCVLAERLDKLDTGRIACHLPDSPELIAIIFAAGLCGRSISLFSHDYSAEQIEPLLDATDSVYIVSSSVLKSNTKARTISLESLAIFSSEAELSDVVRDNVESEIVILTSGTTGTPKCASYLWSSLLAQVKRGDSGQCERWLLAYRLNHFAGIQMISHVLRNAGTLVIADSTQMTDMIDAIATYNVTHVSSTPTFWRFAMALLQSRQREMNLQQITLGSEAASGDLLDQLHELFPDARLVHIYASTETGSCVSVSDMQPGLPASILERDDSADAQFRIVNEELQIKSRNGMTGYLHNKGVEDLANTVDGWRATGDLVRLEDDRIIFVGRKSESINVGGVKVHPLDVESRILPLSGVKVVRAYGRKNPIVGHIVAVEVVCSEDHDSAAVEEEIHSACAELVPAARPRSIRFVDEILVNNLKISRRQSE